jgi:Kef-type K+ transport system membrane component KefB
VLTGMSVLWNLLFAGGMAALLLIAARALGKLSAVLLLARPSGASWRQGLALGIALMPLSGVALVLTYDMIGVVPELAPRLAATVLAVIGLMELLGPLIVRWMLDWSGETTDRMNAPAAPVPPKTLPAAEKAP